MSNPRQVRRDDKLMADQAVARMIAEAYSCRIATVGPDGCPYVIPLLYVSKEGEIRFHTPCAGGHFRANIDHQPRVCFEIDEAGEIFAYGRFECDTSVAYRSVVAFGTVRIIEAAEEKAAFFDDLMTKYHARTDDRPQSFYPRLDAVTVYALEIDRVTGKHTPLPARQDQWPLSDNTKTPDADPPE